MSGNTFGTLFAVTNFGESHGPAIGCVIDGCPPGMALSEADIQPDLDRRRPGTSRHVTQRAEPDAVEILSGVYQGQTTGTPICLLIRNTDQRSKDYSAIAESFRPGHADYTYLHKYGLRDPRGGGRSSARLTAPMVAAGAVAKKWLLGKYGTRFLGCMTQVGDLPIGFESWEHVPHNPFFAPIADVTALEAYMDALRKAGDSCGARIRVVASGMPVGLGQPLFDKLDADIAFAMMGINAVKGVEIGAGFASVSQRGTTHGDALSPQGFRGNNAGGVLGGISTGQDLEVSIAIKPTSSIISPRESIDIHGSATEVVTKGRHDPCVGLRATPIAEAMLALVVMEHALQHRAQCGDVAVGQPTHRRQRRLMPIRPGQLAPFAALSASYFAHIGFFNPYLPLWLKDLGFGLFAISILTSVQSATRLFAPYAWGALSDHTGERVRLMRFSATVAFAVSLALLFPLGGWALGAVLCVMFTHTSSMMPMSEAAMAHLVTRDGGFDARRYGRVRLWGSVGFLITVFAAGAWFEHHGMGHFPAWTALTLLAVVLSVWWLPDTKEHQAHHTVAVPVWPVLRQPLVRWFFAAAFFHVLSHISIYVFFSLYLDELGYSKTVIGMLWAVAVLVEIAWFYSQGRWLPRWSLPTWLVLCAAAMAVRMVLTAAGGSVLLVLLLAQALHALTFAAHHTVCVSLVSRHFPGRLRGRGQALYTVIAYGLTGVLGGLLGGWLSSQWGLATVYWASVATSLVAVACALRVRTLERVKLELEFDLG